MFPQSTVARENVGPFIRNSQHAHDDKHTFPDENCCLITEFLFPLKICVGAAMCLHAVEVSCELFLNTNNINVVLVLKLCYPVFIFRTFEYLDIDV